MADGSKALAKIRSALDHVVRIAARWQAEGLDTSPLAQSLLDIQEAISEVEADARRRRGEGRPEPGELGKGGGGSRN